MLKSILVVIICVVRALFTLVVVQIYNEEELLFPESLPSGVTK